MDKAQKPYQPKTLPDQNRQIFQQDIMPGAVVGQHLVVGGNQKGDLYYSKDGVRFERLPIGETGQVLVVTDGVPVWQYQLVTGLEADKPATGLFTGYMYFSTDTFVLSVWTGLAYKTTTLS